MTARILGVDLGTRRIGLAVADAEIRIARPFATLARGTSLDEDAAALGRVCEEQSVVELVVGLPVEARGNEGEMAAAARAWGAAIAERLGLPVVLRDERLSSFEAETRLRDRGISSKDRRGMVDQEAAAVILQGWLDEARR